MAVSLIKLFGAFTRVPLRLEGRDHSGDLVEIDAIGSRIRTGIGRIFNPAFRDNSARRLAICVGGNSGWSDDVERLVENTVRRSL